MARSYNQFNGIGNLAADPEVRDLGTSGRQVCKLRVMFNDSYKDRDGNVVEESFGIDVNVFGDQQVKYLSDFAVKGDKVLIADGTLKIRKYERRRAATAGPPRSRSARSRATSPSRPPRRSARSAAAAAVASARGHGAAGDADA